MIIRSVSENYEVLSVYLTEASNLLIKYQKPSALQSKIISIYIKNKNLNNFYGSHPSHFKLKIHIIHYIINSSYNLYKLTLV